MVDRATRLKEVAVQVTAARRIIRDASKVDVNKWGVPDDSHLLKSPAIFRDEVHALFADRTCKGDKMPASKAENLLQFRPGEVTLWVGYKESYKSTFLNELATYWACNRIPVCVASLEMPAAILLQRTVLQAAAKETPSKAEIDLALEVLAESLTLYDVTGRLTPRHLCAVMHYSAVELGCRHFLLDNLTMVLSVDNERAAEHQQFIADCCTIARTTGCHVHLVAHCTKPEGGDEGRMPSGYNVRGTGTAPDMVDNIVIVWRNKPKESKLEGDRASEEVRKEPDVIINVDKQRHWDYRGMLKFWIDRKRLRFMQYGSEEPRPFV